jgi:hypothetical protein
MLGLCAVIVAGAALNGCATLSEEQCAIGDWYGIGQSDGAEGRSHARLEEHVEACQRHGVTPDHILYEQGRQQGLLSYCTPQSGFRAGRHGAGYDGVCPAHLEGGFLTAYADGQLIRAAQSVYDAAINDENRYLQMARDIEGHIRNEEAALEGPDLTDEQRRTIRGRIRQLRDDRERALDQARDAEWRMRDAERELNALRARFRAHYDSW